ncbi:uncharacterized protein LOC100905554 [Galendromus occidentalis]|uniref:Uncharacterized protein LOC100905554 n=1 Tax=Galendromus occidentalis TaxID=34638 RepID=A0AAJ6VV23_9ACAR|nr:uncharacterized protein LOC100905554 [Galendromus occidentalis]
MKIYEDCVVFVSQKYLTISNPEMTEFTDIDLPGMDYRNGATLMALERIGDKVFILESLREGRIVDKTRVDRIHAISLKAKKSVRCASVPLYQGEGSSYCNRYDVHPEATSSFVKAGSELFLAIQTDSHEPFLLYSVGLESLKCTLLFEVAPPGAKWANPDVLFSRAFSCLVPHAVVSCDCTNSMEMGKPEDDEEADK